MKNNYVSFYIFLYYKMLIYKLRISKHQLYLHIPINLNFQPYQLNAERGTDRYGSHLDLCTVLLLSFLYRYFSPNSLLLGVLNSFLRCVRLFVTGGVRLSGLVCALSPFMCLPEWWCPPRRSCLCLVSLHVSP